MATAPTEQRELELVEKVYFRILGVANHGGKAAESLLKVYLAPLLLKLGSEYASVPTRSGSPSPGARTPSSHTTLQVMEICRERLTTFIQPPGFVTRSPPCSFELPRALIVLTALFWCLSLPCWTSTRPVQAPLVKHFDLVFIQHSIARIEPADRRELIPKVLRTGSGLMQELALPPCSMSCFGFSTISNCPLEEARRR